MTHLGSVLPYVLIVFSAEFRLGRVMRKMVVFRRGFVVTKCSLPIISVKLIWVSMRRVSAFILLNFIDCLNSGGFKGGRRGGRPLFAQNFFNKPHFRV